MSGTRSITEKILNAAPAPVVSVPTTGATWPSETAPMMMAGKEGGKKRLRRVRADADMKTVEEDRARK